MKNHWAFWIFWVSANAVASFIWGNLVISPSLPSVAGMMLGIAVFIIVYAVIDHYLMTHKHHQLHQSLRKSVYIKAGLQILNLGLLVGLMVSPELWAGIMSTGFTQQTLGIQPNIAPFFFTLINTLITGGLLSLMVAALTILLAFASKMKSKV